MTWQRYNKNLKKSALLAEYFSFWTNLTIFLLITAMAANFYRYIVALPLMAVLFGIKATDRVKSFLFRFIAVPAKWVRTARQYKLNIYSNKPYKLIWEHG